MVKDHFLSKLDKVKEGGGKEFVSASWKRKKRKEKTQYISNSGRGGEHNNSYSKSGASLQ